LGEFLAPRAVVECANWDFRAVVDGAGHDNFPVAVDIAEHGKCGFDEAGPVEFEASRGEYLNHRRPFFLFVYVP
jgi:hypothetical protein